MLCKLLVALSVMNYLETRTLLLFFSVGLRVYALLNISYGGELYGNIDSGASIS
jgi:hypothetical protein